MKIQQNLNDSLYRRALLCPHLECSKSNSTNLHFYTEGEDISRMMASMANNGIPGPSGFDRKYYHPTTILGLESINKQSIRMLEDFDRVFAFLAAPIRSYLNLIDFAISFFHLLGSCS